jgi:hypothetical protein
MYVGNTYSFLRFLSLSQDWTAPDGAPDGVLQLSSHHADIKSHAPPEKYILGVCTCVYVCVCVDMTRGAMIDTGGERNRV